MNTLLFTPGPTPIPESIRLAMATPTIHHRTPEFEAIFGRVRESLLKMLNMSEVLMLASSGTGAMEACVSTFAQKKLLSINSGKFGERFGKIARSHGIASVEIISEWDSAPSVETVLAELSKHPDTDCVAFQICESAGGLRHNAEAIAAAVKAKNPSIFVVADAITAMGVEALDTAHIDALIGGSQKAFMLPPGMSIIGLSKAAVEAAESRSVGFYFNLKTELKNQRQNTTAWTAPTTIIQGLAAYFDMVESFGGIEAVYAATKRRAHAMEAAMKAVGLEIYPKTPALAMTTIVSERAKDIRAVMKKELGVNVAGGQDRLKERIFRINHMGIVPVYESAWVANAVELALDKLGIRKFDGAANRVFLESYFKA